MRIIFVLLLSLGLCACATNPYKDFYHFKAGEAIVPAIDVTPEIIEGKHIEEDIKADAIRMRENNYKLLGYSSFSDRKISRANAIAFGKEIHAEKIILYVKRIDTVSGPIFVSAQSTTYVSETTDIPSRINRYDYFATFWVKGTPPKD